MDILQAKALSNLAPLLEALPFDPSAALGYDMLAGGVVWSDELPEFDVVCRVHQWDTIRYVLRYRTTLILGEPEEAFREYWDEARRQFPRWPGFDERRLSVDVRDAVLAREKAAGAELDELEKML